MIITNIIIDPTIDALLIVWCSYLFHSISDRANTLTLCGRKWKSSSGEEKTLIKIPVKTWNQQGLDWFPSKAERLMMTCWWGWRVPTHTHTHRMENWAETSGDAKFFSAALRNYVLKVSVDKAECWRHSNVDHLKTSDYYKSKNSSVALSFLLFEAF